MGKILSNKIIRFPHQSVDQFLQNMYISTRSQPGSAWASPASDIDKHVDSGWFHRVLAEETGHWRDAAFTSEGFFRVNLDRRWQQVENQKGTLVSQSRQIFVMAQRYELTREVSYLEAVRKGADFLLNRFRDFDQGLFFSGRYHVCGFYVEALRLLRLAGAGGR